MSRLARLADELAAARLTVEELKMPGRCAPRDGGRPMRLAPPAPLAIHSLDQAERIDRDTEDVYWRAASALRRTDPELPETRGTSRTIRQIAFLKNHASELDAKHANLSNALTKTLDSALKEFVRESDPSCGFHSNSVPKLVAEIACPACGETSLWADPTSSRVRCSAPACGKSLTRADVKIHPHAQTSLC